MLVAAGGGGDAIAATLLPEYNSIDRVIATWAWDRLAIDPVPGPRGRDDFSGLREPRPDVSLLDPTTTVRAPAGSTLPRLAASLSAQLVLLDPYDGCRGLIRQLRAAAEWCDADHIIVVDVGGDAIARPGDQGLRSPLADISTVVAAANSGLDAQLVLLGIGCDGELDPSLVERRLNEIGARAPARIDPERARRVLDILEWHPSEATALVALAALGCRGTVEIRDQGLSVTLADETAAAWHLTAASALPPSPLAETIAVTSSLLELEDVFRGAFLVAEIDYERHKAAEISSGSNRPRLDAEGFLAQAAERGVEWVTRRRLREATGSLPETFATALLIPTSPGPPVQATDFD